MIFGRHENVNETECLLLLRIHPVFLSMGCWNGKGHGQS
jgi:hypothetical protein